jgi:prevent-host-death family protein
MTREVQASEAKTHLPQLLDEVERGETIIITRHGQAIARIGSRSRKILNCLADLPLGRGPDQGRLGPHPPGKLRRQIKALFQIVWGPTSLLSFTRVWAVG